MLILKANIELKKVFSRLIKTVNAPVTWTDNFVIANNNLILLGTGRSLIFSFDSKKVYTNLMDIPTENKIIEIIPNEALTNNIMNMTLYAFGKWGSIGGLKVEKDYAALNELFANVFRPLRIEAQLRSENLRFYKNGIQITFEDTVLAAMKFLKDEKRGKGENEDKKENEDGKDKGDDDRTVSEDAEQEENGEEQEGSIGYEADDEYEIGLWHNLIWKKELCEFEKQPQSEKDAVKSRIGNNFYMTDYQCPKCGEKLYMAVYPVDKEILIETEEARVYMARTYACNTCNTFYTPRPEKLLQEGDVYSLKFDQDRVAYEDYLEILGNKAQRTTNYKFNEYESDRQSGKKNDGLSGEEGTAGNIEAGEEQEEKAQKQGKGKTGIFTRGGLKNAGKRLGKAFGARNAAGAKGQEETEETAEKQASKVTEQISTGGEEKDGATEYTAGAAKGAVKPAGAEENGQAGEYGQFGEYRDQAGTEPEGQQSGKLDQSKQEWLNREWKERAAQVEDKRKNEKENYAQKKALSPEMQQNKARLMEKTTEELKVILTGLENKAESVMLERGRDGLAGREYIEVVQDALREKLTAKYDARVETLGNLTLKQLSELKKQIGGESVLSGEEKEKYIRKVDRRLYQIEEKSVEQKIGLSKNKSYAQIGQLIEEIEKGVESEELKQETLKKLKRIKADRAEREVEHLIMHMPLHLDRKQLSAYLEQLDNYKEIDLTPYRNRIEQRKDMAEKEEISAIVRRGGKKDRNALQELYEQLQREDYKEENKAPFLEKIYEKLRKMDEDEIERICPEVASLSFAEGLEAYKKIEQGMFLPELKTNTLEMIRRRLTKIKTDESVQLMRKLKSDMEEKMPGFVHFYFYDAREERRRTEREEPEENEAPEHIAMMRAVNGYASARDEYEYPIVVCDTSRSSNGKEGFVLTPDHIFYRTLLSSGTVSIAEVEKVETGKGLFTKGIHLRYFTGKREKLPNTVKQESWEAFAEILTDFVTYLQEKPESRSISYLAKEKHDVKCCYRCGFVYKEGNICPRCGSKMNQ